MILIGWLRGTAIDEHAHMSKPDLMVVALSNHLLITFVSHIWIDQL